MSLVDVGLSGRNPRHPVLVAKAVKLGCLNHE